MTAASLPISRLLVVAGLVSLCSCTTEGNDKVEAANEDSASTGDGGDDADGGSGGADGTDGGDGADGSDGGDGSEGSDGGETCGDDNPFVRSPEDAVYVCDWGDDDDDGTAEAPLASLRAGLLALRAAGGGEIVIGEGSFDTTVVIDGSSGDVDFAVWGMGTGLTTLAADDPTRPVVHVASATGIELGGLTIEGGRPGVFASGGAELTATSINVREATLSGIRISGDATLFTASDVVIAATQTETVEGLDLGIGLLIQRGSATIAEGDISQSTTVGVLVDGGSLELSDTTVQSTATEPSNGTYGRGLQLQGDSLGVMTDCAFVDNADADVFSLLSFPELSGNTFSDVGAASIPDSAVSSGDSVVVTQGDAGFLPVDYPVSLVDNSFENAARAAVLLEDVAATASGTVDLGGHGSGVGTSAFYVQGGATVSGTDASLFNDPASSGVSDFLFNTDAFDSAAITPGE